MSRYLVRTLVIPLSLAALVSLLFGVFCPWQGFFVNLATSFLSVLITVIYVDRVLQEHDRRRWARVSEHIRKRTIRFGYSVSLGIRIALGFGPEIFGEIDLDLPISQEKIRSDLTKVTENVINPSVFNRLREMDTESWKRLADTLNKIIKQVDSLIDLYGNKLDPNLLQTILDIQSQASDALADYDIVPFVFGVPDTHPKSKTPSVAVYLRDLMIQKSASAICEINTLALKLINLS